ncbi:hypothetical protein HZA38_03040 [Candidatus Peregrinibacteria bacterium]|nr:hypothetical protein [Candidatus Peregrinibacteria bacterium]
MTTKYVPVQDKSVIEDELLKVEGVKEHLEDSILWTAQEIEYLEKRRDEYIFSDLFSDLGDFAQEFREKAFDKVLEGRTLPVLKKRLDRMCYLYQRTFSKLPKSTEWQRNYDHATQEVQILPVVEHFIEVKNPRRSIRCPLHNDDSPSFKIYEATNSFYCFGCQKGGSPVQFVKYMCDCDFKEAVQILSTF